MFCKECGKMVQDGNRFCTGCGTKIEPVGKINKNNTTENFSNDTFDTVPNYNYANINQNSANVRNDNDKNSIGLNVLSFFIPIVGLILFIIWRKEYPKKAKNIGICALIGYILSFLASVVYILWIITTFRGYYYNNMYNDYYKDRNYYEFEDYNMQKYDI